MESLPLEYYVGEQNVGTYSDLILCPKGIQHKKWNVKRTCAEMIEVKNIEFSGWPDLCQYQRVLPFLIFKKEYSLQIFKKKEGLFFIAPKRVYLATSSFGKVRGHGNVSQNARLW